MLHKQKPVLMSSPGLDSITYLVFLNLLQRRVQIISLKKIAYESKFILFFSMLGFFV